MTIASILAAIAALGTIVSAILYGYKQIKQTPEQAKEEIEKNVADEKQKFEDTGRP